MEMLKDINGKESSKRIWSNRILWVALLMVIIYFITFIGAIVLGKAPIEKFPWEIWITLFGSGLAPLGMTLFEQKK